jgi:hypothetical protein
MANLRDLAIRILISGDDQTGPAIRSVSTGMANLEKGVKSFETAARRILGITLFVGLAKEAIDLSDAYKGLQGRLKQVTDSSKELEQVNKNLFAIAQAAQMPLADTVTLYARTALALDKLNNGQELAAKLTETVALSFKAQNSSTSEMNSTVLQLTQSLGTGNVTWEDFGNVAQSNLLLANIAAKNLGYDGIASLKAAIGKAQVSGVQMAVAIAKGFDEVKAKSDAMGLTVKGAWTQINNALLVFIGQSKEANSASSALANALHLISENFEAVVKGVITLAKAYAARLIIGMVASTKAFFDNAAAARVAALAQEQARVAAIALLEVKAREAAVTVGLKQQLLIEAAQRRALATTATAEAVAITRLTAARKAYEVAVNRSTAATARLAATQETAAVSTGIFSAALGVLGKALNGLFVVWMAFDFGKMIGEWAAQFKWFDVLTAKIAEVTEKFMAFGSFMARPLTFGSIKEFGTELDAISARYDEIRNDIGKLNTADADSAVKIKAAEELKTQAIEAAAQLQQQAFATTQAAIKALTKAQSAAIQQGLTERIAAINAADISDTAKESQRVAAKIAAINQTLLLDQQAAKLKLELINSEYAKELEGAQANATRLAGIETSKREAKLSVYRGIAEFYAGEINKLTALYGEETNAFAQSRNALKSLAQQHDAEIREIDRLNKTDSEKLWQDKSEFEAKIYAIQKEQKKGGAADQQKINDLINEAKTLSVNLADAATKGSISQYQAKENLNKLYAVEKRALEDNGKAHQQNAAAIKSSLDSANEGFNKTNALINEITAALNKEYLLKVGMDQASLNAAQSAIAELTKPETKIITVITQSAQSAGGPVGQGYAKGGYAKRSGLLPGFGGGDRIQALLEAGEFIIRKEAVQALGTPILQNYINQGQLPQKFASGGLVSEDEILKKLAEKKAEDDVRIIGEMTNNVPYWTSVAAGGMTTTEHVTPAMTLSTMVHSLERWRRKDLIPALSQIMKSREDYEQAAEPLRNSSFNIADRPFGSEIKAKMDKGSVRFFTTRDLVLEKLKAGATKAVEAVGTGRDLSLPAIMPSINLNQFADMAAVGTGRDLSQSTPSSSLLQGSKKTINVQFAMPGGEPVAGQFNESDMDKLFKTLKDAGLRSTGGHF